MSKQIKKLLFIIIILITGLLSVNLVFAQSADNLLWGGEETNVAAELQLGETDPRIMVASIIRIALGFLGIVALAIVIYAGWLWMTAAGNADKIEKAKKILIGALIGLVIILSSFAIVSFILNKLVDVTGAGGPGGPGGPVIPPIIPGAGDFVVEALNPNVTGTIRNPVIKGKFSKSVDPGTAIANNFKFYVTPVATTTVPKADGTACVWHGECLSDLCDIGGTNNCVGNYVDGTISVSGSLIKIKRKFDARIACPVPNDTIACLSAWTSFKIEAVATVLKSTGGIELSCGLFPCTKTFTTNNLVDVTPPTVNLNISKQLCLDSENTLNTSATDDSGVALVRYKDNNGNAALNNGSGGEAIYACGAGPCGQAPSWWSLPPAGPPDAFIWKPAAGDYSAFTDYTITVTAEDNDDNESSASKKISLKPMHCCNGEFDDVGDADLFGGPAETGVDCGGECDSCEYGACATDKEGLPATSCEDDLCASRYCDSTGSTLAKCTAAGYSGASSCCLCQSAPIIDWVTPEGGFCNGAGGEDTPCTVATQATDCSAFAGTCNTDESNGKTGNFVTIGGRFFGTAVGTVEFNDNNGSGWVLAKLASVVNPDCPTSWKDDEIIVEVPVGLSAGVGTEIRVTAANTFSDTTLSGDGRGPEFDFIVNDISRPGLCQLDPNNGVINSVITYRGVGLNGATAYFGNTLSKVMAYSSLFTTNTTGTAQVPSLTIGYTSSFVFNSASIASNYLKFKKNAEPASGPFISDFDPEEGAPGQYVTISGSGFGNKKGASKVFFNGVEADYSFPAICADSVWSDNQIIVKVPAGGTDGLISVKAGSAAAVTTAALTPSDFDVNAALPLRPSLCKIKPIMGPNNTNILLYGEYFGNFDVDSKVRFQLNKDQTGAAITNWTAPALPDANEIKTKVHEDAVSGLVRVVKDPAPGKVGNGLNFLVGSCTKDTDCGAAGTGVCCPISSYKSGQCASDDPGLGGNDNGTTNVDDCYIAISSSVFEWDFTTKTLAGLGEPCYASPALTPSCSPLSDPCEAGLTCNPSTCVCEGTFSSCSGYSLKACSDSIFCPNSPGQCSPYAGGANIDKGPCGDDACNVGACTTPACTYNNTLNKCIDLTQPACSLASTTKDVLGKTITATCVNYGGANRWRISTSASCPPGGWEKIPGNQCILTTETCSLCASGFTCLDNGGAGVCGINQSICPGGSTCNASNRCEKADSASCDCCCRIGEVGDCCYGLTCAGTCGNDTTNDGTGFGECSGCRIDSNGDGTINAAEQVLSDNACNCTGTSGKYCATGEGSDINGDGFPDGVCKDCGSLAGTAECSSHSTTCCVDNMNSNECRGGAGDSGLDVPDGLIGYCSYYNGCIGPVCDPSTAALTGPYNSIPACDMACSSMPGGWGVSCKQEGVATTTACDLTKCSLECLNSPFAPLTPPNKCGICCCNPAAALDQCEAVNPILSCTPNKGACSGADRGMCCGCSLDSDCGNPDGLGCGFDACCVARPKVVETSPADNDTDVCRNVMIKAEFDSLMNIPSFSKNVIVVGDYGNGICPAGTEYILAKKVEKERGVVATVLSGPAKFIKKVISLVSPKAKALTNTFCAVKGSVSGKNSSIDGVNNNVSTLSFTPSDVLDAKITYYVIIKGDSNTGDEINEGVMHYYEVSMKDGGWQDIDGGGITASDRTFNGVEFYGEVFKFTTMDDQGSDSGICRIDHVKVSPASYLFQTTSDDINEVDNNLNDNSFDSRKDNDKLFTAEAISDAGYALAKIAEVYTWTWAWSSGDTTIVNKDKVNPYAPTDDKQLFEAQPGITDGNTTINATANVTGSVALLPSEQHTGTARVWVFMCENPWPPITSEGLWEPWSDRLICSGGGNTFGLCPIGSLSGASCASGSGTCQTNCQAFANTSGCFDTNYEIYYCRDAGGEGTADDLPAILSDDTVIRGSSTVENVLKEFFFLREILPDISGGIGLSLADISSSTAGAVTASWSPVAGATGYKLYYGASSGNYSNYIDVGNKTTYNIYNLSITQPYYFTVTAYDSQDAESKYSVEVFIDLADTVAPQAPTGLNLEKACDGKAIISWNANTSDTTGYKVYYGATQSGSYGASTDVKNATGVTLNGLNNGIKYYLAVRAYDKSGNESFFSDEVSFTTINSSTGSCFNPTDGLVLWQTFDAAYISGAIAKDKSGKGNDGTIIGATSVAGKVGQALSFDGSNNYVNLGVEGPSITEIAGDKLTLAAWVKTSSNTGQSIISKNAPMGLSLNPSREVVGSIYSTDSIPVWQYASSGKTINNEWHYVALVYDGENIEIFIDGISENITPKSGVLGGDGCMQIGRFTTSGCDAGASSYFNGLIDEVRVYNRALKDSDIKALYDQSSNNSIWSLIVSQWKFDEGGGTIAYDKFGINNGTLTGGVVWDSSGRVGKTLNFNGTSGYVNLGNNISLNMTNDITLEAWVNSPVISGAQQPILSNRQGLPGGWLYFGTTGSAVFLYDNNATPPGSFSNNVLSNNAWNHIVWTSDGATSRFYVNGEPQGVQSQIRSSSLGATYIGFDGSTNDHWKGLIDEISIYNRVLNDNEVKLLYKSYP